MVGGAGLEFIHESHSSPDLFEHFFNVGQSLGYGDTSIFAPDGSCIVEAGLFTEKLITADVAMHLGKHRWRMREQLRMAVIQQNYDAAKAALEKGYPLKGLKMKLEEVGEWK